MTAAVDRATASRPRYAPAVKASFGFVAVAAVGLLVADIAPVAYGHTQMPMIEAMRGGDLSQVTRRAEAETNLSSAIAAVRALIDDGR